MIIKFKMLYRVVIAGRLSLLLIHLRHLLLIIMTYSVAKLNCLRRMFH